MSFGGMRSSGNQKAKVKQFHQMMESFGMQRESDKIAKTCLSQSGWDVNGAVQYFFDNYQGKAREQKRAGNKNALQQIFNKYQDPDDTGYMSTDGMTAFYGHMDVDLTSADTLVLPWKLKMTVFGALDRERFVDGFSELGVDSLQDMKRQVKRFCDCLKVPNDFQEFYRWLFEYAKGQDKTRTVDKNVAIHLFGTVFTSHQYPIVDLFIKFLQSESCEAERIKRDEWYELPGLLSSHKPDMSDYDAISGAWPSLFDEFHEFTQKA